PARTKPRFVGCGRVVGRVVNNQGGPLANAHVSLAGTAAATLSRPNGEFVLDSLPLGTQSIEVRHVGYGVTEAAVDLEPGTAPRVTVMMNDFVALEAVRVEAEYDRALGDVGYLERKQLHTGQAYADGESLRKDALSFSEYM